MNRCILCTFVKMAWEGLRDNSCPSIDKKKEEKKAPTLKVFGELVLAVVMTAIIMLIGYLVFLLVAWILGTTVQVVVMWFTLLFLVPTGLIMIAVEVKNFAKIRIDCIKAYWRKAKEACE